jgi:hypothetical protein
MKRCKLLLAVVAAAVLLGTLVDSASARTFSSSSSTFRFAFRELRFNATFGTVTCQLTYEGSFHSRTIAKVVGALIGYLTAVNLGPCGVGTATILRETLPWHIQYQSFTGVLPNINSIRVNTQTRFRIREPFGATCLFASTPERPATLTFNRIHGWRWAGAWFRPITSPRTAAATTAGWT